MSGDYSIIRILCVGPPGVGKTSLKHALQGKHPPSTYHSTLISDKTSRIHRSSLAFESSSEAWIDFGYDQHVQQLSSIAMSPRQLPNQVAAKISGENIQHSNSASKPHTSARDNATISTTDLNIPHRSDAPISQQVAKVSSSSRELLSTETKSPLVKDDDLLFGNLQNAIAYEYFGLKKEVEQNEILEQIMFTDCGGQPQFLDVLPAFIMGSTVVIVTINLSEGLHKIPKFSFHVDSQDRSLSGNYSSLTTLEMIEMIAYSISVYKRHESEESDPYLMIVATHVDKVLFSTQKINQVNKILNAALKDVRSSCIDCEELERAIIFPIITIDDKAKMAEKIRKKIQNKVMGQKVSIPMRWVSFELHLEAYSEHTNRKILSLKECIEVGSSKEVCIPEAEITDALIHYNCLNVCLYFPKFLPEFVFTDPQVLLEMVSDLLKVSFLKSEFLPQDLPPGSQMRLKDEGILTRKVLEVCTKAVVQTEIGFGLEQVITLLVNLNLIANTSENEYFLPSALEICNEESLHHLKKNCTVHFEPLLLLPKVMIVPQGLFISLAACLLNRSKPPYFMYASSTRQYRNAITLRYSNSGSKIRGAGGGSVLLINQKKWLELCYSGDSSEHAYHIQSAVFDVLPEVCENLPYDLEKINFSRGFYCKLPSSKGGKPPHQSLSPHPCKVDSFAAPDSLVLTCVKDVYLTSSTQGFEISKISWLSVLSDIGESTTAA